MHLTDEEKRRGLVPEWIPLQEALDLFSKHESYADVNEEKRGSYQREYMALSEYYDVDLFSKHESYADVNEEKRGSYQREYMALSEYYDVYEKGVINQSISMEDIKQLPGRESE